MKKFSRFLSVLLLVVLISTTLVGCGGSSKKEIIGKWKVVSLTETESSNSNMLNGLSTMAIAMLFSKGSTVEFIDEKTVDIGFTVVGYKWLNDDKIQLGDESDESNLAFDVTINGNKMTLSSIVIIELERVGN